MNMKTPALVVKVGVNLSFDRYALGMFYYGCG